MFTRRRFLALVPLTAALLAGGCDLPATGGGPVKVSMAEYNRIEKGTTYADTVRDIVGHPGEELARNEMAGVPGVMESVTTVVYSWKNPDGSNMTVTYQNGYFVTKAQFGLPPTRPAVAPPPASRTPPPAGRGSASKP